MKIAVLMGGRSGEHDVSLASGREVGGALDALGHARFDLVFERDGSARWPGGAGSFAAALVALEGWAPDAAFIAMHGPDGEDGRIQATLELMGIAYQGSGVACSALALDKARTKDVYRAAGLPVARDVIVDARAAAAAPWDRVCAELGLPLVLKTRLSGSSVGVEVATTAAEVRRHGDALLAGSDYVLVEEWLPGAEFTCGVLEELDGSARALPLIEIRPKTAAFFDYEAKYTPGASDELCPAPIDDALADALSRLGLAAHAALGCRGYSRTDFKCDVGGSPRLLETNTLPGLTQTSLLPQSAAAVGMSFPALVDHLIAVGRRRFG